MNDANWAAAMRRALELAERGRWGTSPNPMVGAVMLDRVGRVVGEGWHERAGGPHAEIGALATAGDAARGGTLCVTLEPCCHHGRTPPCVDAIVAAGVARVVFGPRDPNPAVDGKGAAALRAHGIEVVEGVAAEESRTLNRVFHHWMASGTPLVTLKMAVTLDGKLAARGGRSRWITGEEARREGHVLREANDAILVGVSTVLADDPRLRRQLGLNPKGRHVRAVLDSRLRIPVGAMLLEEAPADVVIFAVEGAPEERCREIEGRGATVVSVGDDGHGRCDLRQVLRWLGAHEVSSLLVEGGGDVHWSFLHEGLAHRVVTFVAPLILGGRDAVPAVGGIGFASPQEGVRLRFVESRRVGEDLVVISEVCGV